MVELFGVKDNPSKKVIFTPWSIPHLLFGGLAREFGINFWMLQAIHGAYEVKDYIGTQEFLRQTKSDKEDTWYFNSLENSLGDQASATLGYLFLPRMHGHFWSVGFGLTVILFAVTGGDAIG